jgi:hypothetical protein
MGTETVFKGLFELNRLTRLEAQEDLRNIFALEVQYLYIFPRWSFYLSPFSVRFSQT